MVMAITVIVGGDDSGHGEGGSGEGGCDDHVKVHGRDGEGDERLTRASTVMKAMTVSAATVPAAWTSVSAVAVGVGVEGTR